MKIRASLKNCFLFILIVLCLWTSDLLAQAMPIEKMSLTIEMQHVGEHEDILTPKTVKFAQTDKALRLFWYSLVKKLDQEAYFHTYRVEASRGIVETDNFAGKRALILPALWGDGYVRSETALPLWVDPEFLSLKGKKQLPFNAGLLNVNKQLLKAAPDEVFEKVNYLQNLYDQYVSGFTVRSDIKLKKVLAKELDDFIRNFFFVVKLSESKVTIAVNRVNEEYPVVWLGNDYYELAVLNDPLNPLVLNFKIHEDKTPKVLQEQFGEIAKLVNFSVKEITY
ncbi:MAG: hypothetical protein ACD_62C00342G0002 [uncultured bacterium]|nr:MAG: hypothetical protein ACD_62C00342G0002 [uncultured bacterium]HLD45924.1 hypothetical protein [bacterium]